MDRFVSPADLTDEQWRAWLFSPLSLAELLRFELAEAARQFALIEAAERADALMAEVDEQATWREVKARADLAVLAEAPPNPYPERPARRGRPRHLPTATAMMRALA